MKLGLGSAMREVPAVVWVCLTVVFLGVLGTYAYLAGTGSSADDLSRFLNTLMNIVMIVLSGGGLAFGASAAVNAKRASEQTNGQLKDTVKDAAKEAIQEAVPPMLNGGSNADDGGR
jgi:hypothetical protein